MLSLIANKMRVDFGGGFNSSYVDKGVIETTEGDLQGVSRMGEALLDGRKYSLPNVGREMNVSDEP